MRAGRDPSFKGLDLLIGQFLVRRHLESFVPKGLEQKTLDGFLGLDERPGLATLSEQLRAVEPQPRFGLVRTVACDAVLEENRSDPLLEEFRRVLLLRPSKRVRKGKQVPNGQSAGPQDTKLGGYSLGGYQLGEFGAQWQEHGRSIRKGIGRTCLGDAKAYNVPRGNC